MAYTASSRKRAARRGPSFTRFLVSSASASASAAGRESNPRDSCASSSGLLLPFVGVSLSKRFTNDIDVLVTFIPPLPTWTQPCRGRGPSTLSAFDLTPVAFVNGTAT